MRPLMLLFLCYLLLPSCFAQTEMHFKWWNPTEQGFPTIEGQAWPGEVKAPYDRLPARAEKTVREAVWNLSRHTAGHMIRFRSNAESITVRYTVNGDHAMNHMPATGVSGVDLYAVTSDGQQLWCRGRWTFGDTIAYRFTGLKPNDGYHQMGREYRLYLPLYNDVKWLEIGVAEDSYFRLMPVRMEKPIVVYGTSIAQGGCASRPGMAWTSILSRNMDRPLINLAFSGNGRLEDEIIALLTEIDAKIYILDCLPNLTNSGLYHQEELSNRILNAVRKLKAARPEVPVLLTGHAGYTDGSISPDRQTSYTRVNEIQQVAFAQLKAEGHSGLFYLSNETIGLQLDDMVDGTHPNDLGMMHYAEAYEKALRRILQEPTGRVSTTQPCTQLREPDNYDWEDRHRQILQLNRTQPPRMVILANSIIHFWGGQPQARVARETVSWETLFSPMGLHNHAYGWDRIENVLWRVYHGELDGFAAEKVLVMIGTNNLHLNTDEEILEGLALLVEAIKTRQPGASITLMGLLPRRDREKRIAKVNLRIAELAGGANIEYADLGSVFLQPDHTIDESLFSDGLHPNAAGYLKMREPIKKLLETK